QHVQVNPVARFGPQRGYQTLGLEHFVECRHPDAALLRDRQYFHQRCIRDKERNLYRAVDDEILLVIVQFQSRQGKFLQRGFVVGSFEIDTGVRRDTLQRLQPNRWQVSVMEGDVQVFAAPMGNAQCQRRSADEDEPRQSWLLPKEVPDFFSCGRNQGQTPSRYCSRCVRQDHGRARSRYGDHPAIRPIRLARAPTRIPAQPPANVQTADAAARPGCTRNPPRQDWTKPIPDASARTEFLKRPSAEAYVLAGW